ncbi:MAG TPA: two-component regulator propeller domain-containing protein, partial [Bacteroidia bacterium]|nr:two-component regulator propeller domain-containing protein [Bacteroidia bacterium]
MFLFSFSNALTQTILPLNNYNIHDGLPSSEVYHVMQDSKGFMWFGTDHGVCRYDGYYFKTFTSADGLADNTVFECKEDYKGRIWFRSYSGKMSYYYHDSIFRLPDNEKLKSLLGAPLITSFVVDSSDNLYIATRSSPGFVRIDLQHKNSIKIIPLPNNINYLVNIKGAAMPISGGTL